MDPTIDPTPRGAASTPPSPAALRDLVAEAALMIAETGLPGPALLEPLLDGPWRQP